LLEVCENIIGSGFWDKPSNRYCCYGNHASWF